MEQPSVCFLPFWEPHLQYASSRLRAVFPARFLSAYVGWFNGADIYIVVQLCSDRILGRLKAEQSKGAVILYCVCDRQYADGGRSLAGVNSKSRFNQLAEIADGFIVPTECFKQELKAMSFHQPIYIVPDAMDYPDHRDGSAVEAGQRVVWFGNPGTGNIDAAQPYLLWLIKNGFSVSLISRASGFRPNSIFRPRVLDWKYDTFTSELRRGSFSVISISEDEAQKSENRLVTSVMNGVPALISGRSASSKILVRCGLTDAIVDNPAHMKRAVRRIQDPAFRRHYLNCLQATFSEELSDQTLAKSYVAVFQQMLAKKKMVGA